MNDLGFAYSYLGRNIVSIYHKLCYTGVRASTANYSIIFDEDNSIVRNLQWIGEYAVPTLEHILHSDILLRGGSFLYDTRLYSLVIEENYIIITYQICG